MTISLVRSLNLVPVGLRLFQDQRFGFKDTFKSFVMYNRKGQNKAFDVSNTIIFTLWLQKMIFCSDSERFSQNPKGSVLDSD